MSHEDIKLVGGSLCLDFINTVDAWASRQSHGGPRNYGDNPLREKLVDYGELVRFGQLTGLLNPREAGDLVKYAAREPRNADATLARALRLRSALFRILKCVLERWIPDEGDMNVLQRELLTARRHEQLLHQDGMFAWQWQAEPEALDRMLWPVVGSAAELLTSDELGRLRQCRGEECGWMFLDLSRNHSRQWCDMSDCGNLEKVRRWRQRN